MVIALLARGRLPVRVAPAKKDEVELFTGPLLGIL
jgi:hypothetical protein